MNCPAISDAKPRRPAIQRRSPATNRPTILLVGHESDRSGAPALTRALFQRFQRTCNVVTILLVEGRATVNVRDAARERIFFPTELLGDHDAAVHFLRAIVAAHSPRYAIANGTMVRRVAIRLADIGVSVTAIVNEFSGDFEPVGRLHHLFLTASQLVFATQSASKAAERDYVFLRSRRLNIIAPGPITPSDRQESRRKALHQDRLTSAILNESSPIVVGSGTGQAGGREAFGKLARELSMRYPRQKLGFAWINEGGAKVGQKPVVLSAQPRQRVGGQIMALDPAGARLLDDHATIHVLTARRDTFPNSALHAATRGIPVVCWDDSGWLASWLAENESLRSLVVASHDFASAARIIRRLSADAKYYRRLSVALKRRARSLLDMPRYAKALHKLAEDGARARAQHRKDLQFIADSGLFDPMFCFGEEGSKRSSNDLIATYLHRSDLSRPYQNIGSGAFFRRPIIGFNPLIYESDCHAARRSVQNPLAHFLRAGKPSGRWRHDVILPPPPRPSQPARLNVALHGHFHYPDLVNEFLESLRPNRTPIKLFLTTTSGAKAINLERMLARHNVSAAEVTVTPNRGRDLKPFLDFLSRHGDDFDVVGHLHGKKSPHLAGTLGQQWRIFAFQNLLGGTHCMADAILHRFLSEPRLGLVFPEDPHLSDWGANRKLGEMLARRMRIATPLPSFFDFPIGSMFWVRPQALKPLQNLKLSKKDFPAEPLPLDGTLLHTLERLLPFSAEKAGYHYATTHVPGCWR